MWPWGKPAREIFTFLAIFLLTSSKYLASNVNKPTSFNVKTVNYKVALTNAMMSCMRRFNIVIMLVLPTLIYHGFDAGLLCVLIGIFFFKKGWLLKIVPKQ